MANRTSYGVGGFHVDRVPGVSAGTLGKAVDRNSLQEEINSPIEDLGVALDVNDWMQLNKVMGLGARVGAIEEYFYEKTPVTWQAARSKANPANPRYTPLIAIWDSDHDVDAAQAPLLVAEMRASKAKAMSVFPSTYVTDHTGITVTSHVLSSGASVAWDNLLTALADDQLIDSAAHDATNGYQYNKGAYTNWRCINVDGVDYAITNVNPGARTITITGDALAGGGHTAIWYPYRIAGQATKIRLFRDSGRALMSMGTIEMVGGGRRRDRGQGHLHSGLGSGALGSVGMAAATNASGTYPGVVTGPVTDNTNGTPRIGATTWPPLVVVYRYINAVVLLT